MSKSKIPADRIPNAKAKAVSQVGNVSDLRARRLARIEANKKLVRAQSPTDKQENPTVAQVAESNKDQNEAERVSLVPGSDAESYVEACKDSAPIESDNSVVATIDQPTAKDAPAVEALPDAVNITVSTKLLRAALMVAAKDDSRYYLNGVRIHQTAEGQTRIAATDGTRLLVVNLPEESPIEWAASGVTLPSDQLLRILRYFGKDADYVTVGFGVGHPHVVLSAQGDGATFKVVPVNGGFPEYQRVMDSGAEAFTAERDGVAAPMLNPEFLKSASQVAAHLEADGIMAHVGATDGKSPIVFTFEGVDNALLYIMPRRTADDYSLPEATVKMYGRSAMKKTVEDLRAQAAKCLANAKKAKHDKFKTLFKAKAARLTAQADSIEASNTVKIAGPKADVGAVAAAVSTAKAVTTASIH